MKSKMALVAIAAATFASAGMSPVVAATIDFEAPTLGNNVGSFYPGVTFSTGAIAVSTSTTYPGFGNQELGTSDFSIPSITATFTAPQTSLSFYYTTLDGIVATAYNSANVAVGSFSGAANVNIHSVGVNGFASISGTGISYVTITDDVGIGESFTIDNFSFPAAAASAPDATGTLGLFGVATLGLLAFHRKLAF